MSYEGKRLVVVGDHECSKTSLLSAFVKNQPEEYEHVIFDNHSVNVEVDGRQVQLRLCDTTGQEEYPRLRPLSYCRTDVILMCFSIGSPASLKNVLEKWTPEVKRFCYGVPIILVGTKMELRNDTETITKLSSNNQEPVKTEEGHAMAQMISALTYSMIECNSKSLRTNCFLTFFFLNVL